MKVIGIEERQGVYEGNPYHNFLFHGTKDIEEGKGIGAAVELYKVKANRIIECLGKSVTREEIYGLIGSDLSFGLDSYKQVNLIRVIEKESVS